MRNIADAINSIARNAIIDVHRLYFEDRREDHFPCCSFPVQLKDRSASECVANNYEEEKRRGERTKRENVRTRRERRREERKRSDRCVGRQSVISSVIDHRANVTGLARVSGLPTEYRPPIGSRQL